MISATPQSVIADPDLKIGQKVIWGGTILDTKNLESSTQLEVLSYPLSRSHQPQLEQKPMGRFILIYPGYLEPTTYAQGRLLTVLGTFTEIRKGTVGESSYSYPLINSEKLQLWNNPPRKGRSSFQFGIGIRL